MMNWKLIFNLSLFGVVMAFATVYLIPTRIEPFFWLIIFIICAYYIAKNCTSKYFLHGLIISLLNSIYVTAAHLYLFNAYIFHHWKETEMMTKMTLQDHPRLMMLLMGPVVGLVSGIVLGLFALVAAKIMKKQSV